MAAAELDAREHPGEAVRLVHPAGHPGLEVLRARFTTRSFPRHSHEGYAVGVIEQGALRFDYRGENVVAAPGRINTVNPDEVHNGHAADGLGWTYRMFYFTPEFLARMAADITGRPGPLPFLAQGVIDDPALAGLLRQAHALCGDAPNAPLALRRDALLLEMFALLLARHACDRLAARSHGPERAAVGRACELMRARPADDLRLDDLARAASLSPYHFLRVFTKATGLTPHAWLMQQRVREARKLLLSGAPIAQAAAHAGFADQSHLNKAFKRLLGYTPGQLRNSVQGA